MIRVIMIDSLKFEISDQYKGTGVSYGLDRGLLVYAGEDLLIQEGMGIGACAIQSGGYTYFMSLRSIVKAERSVHAVFSIDTILLHQTFGVKSKLLTRVIEYACSTVYMKNERWQKTLFGFTGWIRKALHLGVAFEKVKPLGLVCVDYTFLADGVTVDVSATTSLEECTLFVMNELGGDLFDLGITEGVLSDPPSGWKKKTGSCELYSRAHSLAFSAVERHVPDHVETKLFWGREKSESHSWAGFESEITFGEPGFKHYTYSVLFRKAEVRI